MEITNRNFIRFLEAIKYSDFAQSFSDSKLGKSFQELHSAFNQVVEKFKTTRVEKEKSFRYMNTIIQSVNNGLICFDYHGNIDFINRAAKKILDVRYSKNIKSFIHQNPELFRLLKKIRHGERILEKIKSENDIRQMAFYCAEFRIGTNNLKLVSIQDIHNVLEENELDAWQKLIRVLTHEIMNSLTPISSLSSTTYDMIKNLQMDSGNIKSQLLDIQNALNTINKRSIGLIDFVKAYRSMTLIPEPKFKIVPVLELFNKTVKILQHKIIKHQINVHISVDPVSLEITADPSLMEQVLINLLINAIDALKNINEPKIVIESLLDDIGNLVIRISDNGTGIDEKNKGEIFVPFYSTKKSSGIGLSFCKQIMKLHSGSIRVSSQNGETTFSLYF